MIFEEKTLKSEMVYRGKVLNLRRDEVMTVSGKPSIREIVEHGGGVALVAVTDKGKVIMERQFRKPLERVVLEIPAGKLEDGEDPLSAAGRELAEETGYRAEKIEYLTKYYPSVGYCQEALYMYLCTGLTKGQTDLDEDEAIDIYEYSFEELYDMIDRGELEDGKTMAALLAAQIRHAKKEKKKRRADRQRGLKLQE